MQKFKLSVKVNAVLSVLAIFSLIILYAALSDIADGGGNSSLEWYIAGTCMIILSAFTIFSLFTSVSAFKYLNSIENIN